MPRWRKFSIRGSSRSGASAAVSQRSHCWLAYIAVLKTVEHRQRRVAGQRIAGVRVRVKKGKPPTKISAHAQLAGQRSAVVMSLVVSAKLNDHDPWGYLKDVLTRLPTHMNSRLDELLPHRWQPLEPGPV